jgi:tetratricopeptide (TPR) repeat protein
MSSRTVPAVKTKEGLRSPALTPKRSPPMAALRFVFVGLPARAAWAVRVMPWWQRLVLLLLVVVATGASGYFLIQYRAEERRKREISARWIDFEQSANKLDLSKMTAALQRLEQLQPGDPLVKKRQESLSRGSADGDDALMNVYWMKMDRVYGKFDAEVAEARNRIVTVPDDWLARCILAHAALMEMQKEESAALKEQKKEEAIAHLAAMPSPFASRSSVGPSDLDYAMLLFRNLQRDDKSLRRFRATRIAPLIKDPEIIRNDPRVLTQLLRSYVSAFEDIGTYNELVGYWVGSYRVAQFLAQDPASSVEMLTELGEIQLNQLIVLNSLAVKQKFSDDDARAFRQELDERSQEIWKKVREMRPDSPDGYFGAAYLEEIQHRLDSALYFIKQAREKSGDADRYLQHEVRFRRLYDRAGAEFELLQDESAKKPERESLLRMVADAALRAGRIDKALEAARQARKIDPKQTWTAILEARVLLDQEKTDEALDVLKQFKSVGAKDPVVSELYVRTLCLKSPKEVRPYLDKMLNEATSADAVVPSLWAAQRAGLTDDVADVSAQLAKKFLTYNRNLLLVVGDSNGASAEPKTETGAWNKEKLDAAINSFRRVQQIEPDNLEVANSLAWFYLKGLKTPDNAAVTAAPLYKAEADGRRLPSYMHVTLGAIDLDQKRLDTARRRLLQAIEASKSNSFGSGADDFRTKEHDPFQVTNSAQDLFPSDANAQLPPPASAEIYVYLAQAYIGLNQNSEARQCLQLAASLPRSPRVSQELKQAQTLLERNP